MAASWRSPTLSVTAPRPVPGPGPIIVVIDGRIVRADLPWLCERVRTLLEGRDGEVVVYDVGGLVDADVGTVDALARLQLTARRLGRQVALRHASRQLLALLNLVGLEDLEGQV